MNPGKLNRRIEIMKHSDGVENDFSNDAYETYKTLWSKVEYVSSKEIYSANADNTLNVVKFIIRYNKSIKDDMRIRFDGSIYEIKGKRPLTDKHMYLMIVGEVMKHE